MSGDRSETEAADAGPDRRRVLQLMAASAAMAGLAGCSRPPERAVPYVRMPPGIVPGETQLYASAVTRDGFAVGTLVRHRQARPIKIEGNPDHPASLGATDAITEAALLDLYDPDRSRTALQEGHIASADSLVSALFARLPQLAHGSGLAVLTETTTSPTLARIRTALATRYPEMRWHHWDGGFRDAARAAAQRAFGRPIDAVLRLDHADRILAVDSDLLDDAPGHLAYDRAFARRRRELAQNGQGNRLYAIESTPTLTGANADHRFVVPAGGMAAVMRALAARLGAAPQDGKSDNEPGWLEAVADDLQAAKGRALIHVGPYQPAEIHLLGHAVNAALGAPGQTIAYIDPVAADSDDEVQSLAALVADLRQGRVDTLLILGGNPAFTAPPDLGFAEALGRAAFSLHLATYVNETTALCRWHLPQAHELESWGDARAFDGTATIQQPQLQPLYDGWTAAQLLAVLTGETRPDAYALVRATWEEEATRRGGDDFAAFWTAALRAGVVADTAAPAQTVTLQANALQGLGADPPAKITVLFRPDPWLRDGRHANNGWLLELPRPLTKLTWDNAALVAPALAHRLGADNGTVVELKTAAGSVRAPIWVTPGQAADCITLPFGFGRRVVGGVGKGAGFDPFPLRSSKSLTAAALVDLAKTSHRMTLATTQLHHRMQGAAHDIARAAPVAAFRRAPDLFSGKPPQESLYPAYPYPGYAWAMAIDLSSCIGCSACVAACAAENNTPVVGKAEVARGRDMHWLRVDRYYEGDDAAPSETRFQPVPCMHCEDAPCEVVCPVEATVHDHDGLNVMVYNRCIGTRFCSNNCPYKVRRFNWLDYSGSDPRLDLAWNPDLSVRGRGVMEKCTYCIQRIREAEITADRENRRVRDGEIVTACQAACPTQAIVFGDRNDAKSAVRQRKASPLDYGLFEELNTRPRTTYQARLTNPNPELTGT